MKISRLLRYYLLSFSILYLSIGLLTPWGLVSVDTFMASWTLAAIVTLFSLLFYWFWDSGDAMLMIVSLFFTGFFGAGILLGARWVNRTIMPHLWNTIK